RHRRCFEPLETPALRERGQQKDSFHPGKRLADADTVTAAEWKIRKLRPPLLALRQPPIRIEPLRFRKEPRVMVQEVLRHEDDGPARNRVATDLDVVDSAAADAPRRRIAP